MQNTLFIVIPTLAVILAAAWWIRRSILAAIAKPRDDQSFALLQNQVNALNTQVAQALDNTRKSMDERLDNAARVIHAMRTTSAGSSTTSCRIFSGSR